MKISTAFVRSDQPIWKLLQLIDRVTYELYNTQSSVGIFLDLSKAFDAINLNILIDTLDCYGLRGISLQWIKS